MKLMPALLKRSRAASPVEDFCEVTRVFDFSMIAHSSFLKNSFNVGVGIGLQQLVADRFIPGRKLLEFSKRPKHDCKRLHFPRRVESLMVRGFALSTPPLFRKSGRPGIDAAIPAAHNEDATAKIDAVEQSQRWLQLRPTHPAYDSRKCQTRLPPRPNASPTPSDERKPS